MTPDPDRAGPTRLADGRVLFRLWAPAQQHVSLEVDGAEGTPLERGQDGWFEGVAMASPGARYRFRLADGKTVPDPASRAQAGDVHGWSLLTDPNAYIWRHGAWRGRPWREAVIQEVHCGLLGGFAGVASRLPQLAALGVTAIELMPVNAFSGLRNWGYDGVLPYAPAAAYGPPEALKALVDNAHGQGIMVLLDVVYNHFGPDGNYIPTFAPAFFDESRDTPWGGAMAMRREPVARFFIDNALYWLDEFQIDGLRIDAAHAIGDSAFLDRLAASVRERFPARQVHLVLENEANDADRLTRGFTAQWNDDFHNVMHVLLTGETGAYYQDFAEQPAAALARALAEGFIYQGQPAPSHGGVSRGTPSGRLPPTAFVAFLQNHDQVGNRAMGERLTQLAEPAALRAAMALLLLSPQIPLLFMGEETGSTTPFLFFTDFHDALADQVREGRRREFAKFPAFSEPQARSRIPDPNAKATFEASRPQSGEDAENWRRLIADLLQFRREQIVPQLDACRSLGAQVAGPKAVLAAWRLGEQRLTLAINLDAATVTLDAMPTAAPRRVVGEPPQARQLPGHTLIAWLEDLP